MGTTPPEALEPPRFESSGSILFAGLAGRYDGESAARIPELWHRFGPLIGSIPGQIDKITYGVIYNFAAGSQFDYLCAVAVASADGLPPELTTLQVPARYYAVFRHGGPLAGLRATMSAIWSQWLPQSGLVALPGPTLERYGPEFDPRTGTGGLEIWVPIER